MNNPQAEMLTAFNDEAKDIDKDEKVIYYYEI